MRITTRISFAVMVPLIIVSVRQASRVDHLDPPALLRVSTAQITHSDPVGLDIQRMPSSLQREDISGENATDLYGNDVTEAVAEYGLDAAGSLYEQHSPRTELPRLSPPKS